MKVIICTARKGGVGKSVLAVNLAAIWGQGAPTLLIDLDAQADATAALGVAGSGELLAEALSGRASLETAIRPTRWGVDVAGGGEALGHIADSIAADALERALASVRPDSYSYVLIDCPPSLSRTVLSAWRVPSATAVVPVDGPEALRGVVRLGDAWEDAGLDRGRLRVVLSRHSARRLLDRGVGEQARGLCGPQILSSRIRESVVVRESTAWRRPLVFHAPNHAVTEDLRQLAREIARG
jgi:chromosome partitioning protein